MIQKVSETISGYNMLAPHERVCVALSGGADSVSLLLALKELGYEVFAVHVNHNLRGEESDRDESFCLSLCESIGVTVFVESVDVLGFCRENRVSTEEGARKLRYAAIEKHLSGCKLATAHNLNDCFETTLFNLVRGCGISGLRGIPAVRGHIIRPLIAVTREEIEEYLSSKNQSFVTDSSNSVDDCSRNIIRLNVVPQLLRLNPSLYKTYSAELAIFASAYDFISDAASDAINEAKTDNGYCFSKETDDMVISQAMAMLLREHGIEPSSDRVSRMKSLLTSDGKINIASGVYVLSESGRISFETDNDDIFIPCGLKGNVCVSGKTVNFTEISQFDISCYNNKSLKWIVDTDKLCGPVCIRSYKGNEKIKLHGREHTSIVKKLLAKTPPSQRKRVIVISDSYGAFFVEGFGIASRVLCGENTTSAVKIDIKDGCKNGT